MGGSGETTERHRRTCWARAELDQQVSPNPAVAALVAHRHIAFGAASTDDLKYLTAGWNNRQDRARRARTIPEVRILKHRSGADLRTDYEAHRAEERAAALRVEGARSSRLAAAIDRSIVGQSVVPADLRSTISLKTFGRGGAGCARCQRAEWLGCAAAGVKAVTRWAATRGTAAVSVVAAAACAVNNAASQNTIAYPVV